MRRRYPGRQALGVHPRRRWQYLKGCELFDVYTGAPIPVGYKSVAFSLTLRADDQTLTDDHAEETMQSVLKALKETFNATIR